MIHSNPINKILICLYQVPLVISGEFMKSTRWIETFRRESPDLDRNPISEADLQSMARACH